MKINFKNLVRNTLKQFDIGITRYSNLEKLYKNALATRDLEILLTLNKNQSELLQYFGKSKSQIRQDLFVLSHLGFKKNGFFVEFGATDGVSLSNTYLMENLFEWNGILAEPATCWHKELKNNRTCNIETNCALLE